MVGDIKLSKKDIKKIRLSFWALWLGAISIPVSLIVYSIDTSWGMSLFILIVCIVLGFNYCEELIKRRQWKAENTVIRCECGHTQNIHDDNMGSCRYYKHNPEDELHHEFTHCICLRYIPAFWTMSGRV